MCLLEVRLTLVGWYVRNNRFVKAERLRFGVLGVGKRIWVLVVFHDFRMSSELVSAAYDYISFWVN